MIDPIHLLNDIIRPVLKDLQLHSPEAGALVLGTACKESECGRWLRQLGEGPAIGIYQMEPATHDDIWKNYLPSKPALADRIVSIWSCHNNIPAPFEMIYNLAYATAMCRIHYLRVEEKIPHDLPRQAAYWKKYYNTEQGAGTADEYIRAWYRFVPHGVV